MDAAFVDLAHSCAPSVEVETLAAVVSLESRFEALHIRIKGAPPLGARPASKGEAVAIATSLMAEHQDIQLGLGGIGVRELQKLNLTISDAFDPCLNLQATATLLDGYYRLAYRAGADSARAETVMVRSYYGRNDPTAAAMDTYEQRVRAETTRLAPELAQLSVLGAEQPADVAKPDDDQAERQPAVQSSQTAEAMPWDVFSTRRNSSLLIFQHDRTEPTE
jgi:type IV secretion system protein VirB1